LAEVIEYYNSYVVPANRLQPTRGQRAARE